MKQLTKKEAIKFEIYEVWKNWTPDQIVKFQLFQKRLCLPWDLFHKSIEEVLGRPVFTHEFTFHGRLEEEYLGKRDPPTLQEIIELIPEEKRVVIFVGDNNV